MAASSHLFHVYDKLCHWHSGLILIPGGAGLSPNPTSLSWLTSALGDQPCRCPVTVDQAIQRALSSHPFFSFALFSFPFLLLAATAGDVVLIASIVSTLLTTECRGHYFIFLVFFRLRYTTEFSYIGVFTSFFNVSLEVQVFASGNGSLCSLYSNVK